MRESGGGLSWFLLNIKYPIKRSVIFKEFELEFPGILNWAIEGYRKYQDEGVEEPKVVLDAIKEYRSDSDTLGRFMEECCTTLDSSISTKDLFKAYES